MGRPNTGAEPAMLVDCPDRRPRRMVVQRMAARYAPRRHEILECGHRVTVRPSDPLARTRRCDACPPEEH
jgi:hypothetical protein